MRALGLDPGYGLTGWGVVDSHSGHRLEVVQYGVLRTSAELSLSERLNQIYHETVALLKRFEPEQVVVEKLFFSRNQKTVEGVFQARGVILAAVAEAKRELIEPVPGSVKNAMTGNGRATKREVTLMVRRLLNIPDRITPDDAADALAMALYGLRVAASENVKTRHP